MIVVSLMIMLPPEYDARRPPLSFE
ncbi:hypothetical protein FP2506_03179 [Fulvimarina pelagi HTCC2506]|uniref:Uncharacterized protein n=1 Tax=Fulvimarina pelagi HTCC2506 TaxID=314231 RepID=Q0G097_9HYPH|nr:hypothetical protein FP2506_03179 [Fulvimarina pelagi HTCC2506]